MGAEAQNFQYYYKSNCMLTSAVKNVTAMSEYPVVLPVIQIFPTTGQIL